jgi:hypothetical protein
MLNVAMTEIHEEYYRYRTLGAFSMKLLYITPEN